SHADLRHVHGDDHDLAPARPAGPPRADHPAEEGGGRPMTAAPAMAPTPVANAAPEALLTVEHLTMRFRGLGAVDDVSFVAHKREITGVIGPNGAGKTTVFNCITGFYKPTVGRITLTPNDRPPMLLERMDGYLIGQRAGVARTFQNIRLFAGMSVL